MNISHGNDTKHHLDNDTKHHVSIWGWQICNEASFILMKERILKKLIRSVYGKISCWVWKIGGCKNFFLPFHKITNLFR